MQEEDVNEMVSCSLYIKNIDKKVEKEDFIIVLKPLYGAQIVDEEVEIVVMKKGKMRGQGFMNFKSQEKAIEAKEMLDGMVLSKKPIKVQYS